MGETLSVHPSVSPPSEASPSVRGVKGAILVIDDSDISREMMVKTIEDAGLEATSLPSPIGATRLAMRRQIAAVVIDVMMPGMRGDRLAALFRGNKRFIQIPVILVSGEDAVDLHSLRAAAGADAVVSKKQLHNLVSTIVHAYGRRASLK